MVDKFIDWMWRGIFIVANAAIYGTTATLPPILVCKVRHIDTHQSAERIRITPQILTFCSEGEER